MKRESRWSRAVTRGMIEGCGYRLARSVHSEGKRQTVFPKSGRQARWAFVDLRSFLVQVA